MKNFELLRQLSDNKNEIKDFIDETNKILLEEQLSAKTTLINQLIGHYNQLLVRIQDIITKDTLNKCNVIIKNMTDIKKGLEKDTDINKKLVSLNSIYDTLNKSYKEICDNIYTNKNLENNVSEYNNLVMKANDNITKLNTLDIPNSIKDDLMILYNSINKENIEALKTFVTKTSSIIDNKNLENDNSKGDYSERVFSLFAKINDQIIDSAFINKDSLVYAQYTLEDNSKYYAIVKEEKDIEILNQSFSNLPNLVLTKDNIIETCKTIIKNAGIYYDINEYMRYVEKSYKNKMTKEIDEVILKYKNRLQELENYIILQLSFIDDIALLVNHKPCDKYPNITYNDISLDKYFPNYNDENDSKQKEIEHLIIEVLLNPNIKSEFNTKSILKTLYDSSTIDSLISSNYIKEDSAPIVNTSDNIINELESTGNIKTNFDKIKDYLNMRVEELKLLDASPKINVTITKDDNNIFKDINTVLDLNTAISICDKVYKKGQGEYAVIDYLKTGNTLKFTSKYKARDLASSVNRDNYLKLLLENIFKRYLLNKDNNSFIESILSKDSISIKDIVNSLLADNNLLITSITNFDYDFLDSTSDKAKRVEELLNNKEDSVIVKINKILDEIRRIEKVILES